MAKKKRAETVAAVAPEIKAPVRPSVSFRVMNNCGPVPIAKPVDFIQLPYCAADSVCALFHAGSAFSYFR